MNHHPAQATEEKSCFIIATLSALGAILLTVSIGYGAHQAQMRQHDAQCTAQIEAQQSMIDQAGGTWNKIKTTFGAGDVNLDTTTP